MISPREDKRIAIRCMEDDYVMGKFKQWMMGWKVDDFFRQLATVVIGIIITFGGSSLIQKSAQKREARHLLETVRIELQNNIVAIKTIKDTQFLLYLFQIYDSMFANASNISSYSDIKVTLLNKYFDNVDRKMVETVFEPTDPHAVFANMVADPHIARYLIETANEDWLDNLIRQQDQGVAELEDLMAKIDEEIK